MNLRPLAPSILAPVTVKGITYAQKGGEIIDKLRSGILPPPYRNNKLVLKLGPYTRVITELKREKFSFSGIARVLSQHGVKVTETTVRGFAIDLGIHQPKSRKSSKS